MNRTAELIRSLYVITSEMRQIHNRKFPLDGLLVGDIGEAWAAVNLGLELLPPGTSLHDARDPVTGKMVQIKTTQNNGTYMKIGYEELLVLKLHPDGSCAVIWHGDGATAWAHGNKEQVNGERQISFSKLAKLPQTGRFAVL